MCCFARIKMEGIGEFYQRIENGPVPARCNASAEI
ncbi:hypothetical protein SMB34_21715 [Thalassospira permensis NBRC 106175]|uniref:Uncharacterized protein n=1 Tax=Thalassospira permensis NBRC 106175 TaxID=1353532 RepID=A0ABR4TJ80_9PROT|nr:hypothetical protein SMB34_21715 [Thalassospira permensis NBRC 106175]